MNSPYGPGEKMWPLHLVDLLPSNKYMPTIVAMSGTSYPTRTTSVASRVYNVFNNAEYSYYFDAGGPTDVLTDLQTAAQVITRMQNYLNGVKAAAGSRLLKTFGMTMFPGAPYGATDPVRLEVNALMKSLAGNGSFYDYVIDMGAIPELQDFNNPTWFSDFTHPTTAGGLLIANLTRAAMRSASIGA